MSTYATDIFEGAGLTEFTLTFSYLSREHIVVTRIESDSSTTALTVITSGTPTGDEYIWKADDKIEIGTALVTGQKLQIQRDTPENEQLVQWADGSYIIADDLNESDLQWLYNIQELEDQISTIDGTVIGEAVKQVTGVDPIEVDNTDDQRPVVSIDETQSTDDLNALTSDTRVLSEKAADDAYATVLGPGDGSTTKLGRIRIDDGDDGILNRAFFWSGTAWVQVGSDKGPPGPPGPAPGLQDPPAEAVNIPLNPDGTLGTATAAVSQDPSTMDLKFLFGVPVGEKGEQGEPGPRGPEGEGVSYQGLVDATTDAEPADPSNGDFYINTVTGSSSWTGVSDINEGDRLIWNESTGQWDRIAPPPITGAVQPGDPVSILANDVGYITAADLPPTSSTLQEILDNGNTSTTELWIGTGGNNVVLKDNGTVEAKGFRIDLLATLP